MKKRGALIIFVALLGVYLALLFPRLMKVNELNERSAKLDTELLKIRTQNQSLEQELRMLQSDPVYLEKVAREKFNKAKEGEIVYKIVRD